MYRSFIVPVAALVSALLMAACYGCGPRRPETAPLTAEVKPGPNTINFDIPTEQ